VADSKKLTPEQVAELVESGHTYVDVRSRLEFEEGHVPGSFNVPLMDLDPSGRLAPNRNFMAVMEARFGKEQPLILGCRSGGRSRQAALLLLQAGYLDIAEMPAGWEGARDAFGRPTPGWRPKGLPVETGHPEGRCYTDLES